MTGQIQTNNIGRPRDDLAVERLEDDLLILDKHNQKVHQLNETASAIWASISAGKDVKSVVLEIVETYDISPATAARDVAEVVGELFAQGLLEEPVTHLNN